MATSPDQPNADDGSFPTMPDYPASGTGVDPAAQAADTLLFRRYRVLRELGRGGMGVVMLAHDTALDIPVAVKLVPDLVVKDTEAVADLRKEVLRGMALMNPGIVRTHNFEKDEGGAGIVMEYIEGDSLADLKQRQPGGCFNSDQILPWLEQLCSVLDYAHRQARIVHRDLKPRNIMLTRDGRIKVADFGIAAQLSDTMSRHSMEGISSGTLCYMSPQQAEGKRPTELDDIHALGATIFELLTSKPPFFRGNHPAIFHQLLSVTPPSLAERRRELEVIGKAPIPAAWEEVVASCLAKDPAARPPSAGEVFRRLKSGLAAEPIAPSRAAPPPPLPPSAGPETRAPLQPSPAPAGSRRFPWVAAALAAIVLLALFAWAGFHFVDARKQLQTAQTPRPLETPAPRSTPVAVPIPTIAPAPAPTPAPANLPVSAPPPSQPDPPPKVVAPVRASLADQMASLPVVRLPAPPFVAYSAESGLPTVKKLPLRQISAKANAITDEDAWLDRNGLVPPEFNLVPSNMSEAPALPASVPREFAGRRLFRAYPAGDLAWLLYSPRLLVGVDVVNDRALYAFDFSDYAFAPKTKDKRFTEQDLTSVVQKGEILYVAHGHRTYAKDSGGQNAYISAYSLPEAKLLWCSRPLVCNSGNFLVIGDVVVTGYGFTDEPDFLYQLNRWTGAILETIPVKSGPEMILRKGNRLFVRTYNLDYLFECPEAP